MSYTSVQHTVVTTIVCFTNSNVNILIAVLLSVNISEKHTLLLIFLSNSNEEDCDW